MSDDLYPDAILALARNKAGQGRLPNPHATVTVDNPLCGDRVTLDVKWAENGTVLQVAHVVRGCALCHAAATLVSDRAPGKSNHELAQATGELKRFLHRERDEVPNGFPDLAVFEPVRSHKSRFDCVLLPFAALLKSIKAATSSRQTAFPQ